MRNLRNGIRGSDVEFMQRLLVRADVRDRVEYPFYGSDGLFGSETERAVRAFTMVRIHDPWPPGRGIVYGTFVTPIVLRGAGNWIAVSLDYLLIPV